MHACRQAGKGGWLGKTGGLAGRPAGQPAKQNDACMHWTALMG